MTHNKRSKLSRARGSFTHGGGSKKKRRGAGHRGGRGRAGSGKKGDAKKPRYWAEKKAKGFYSVNAEKIKTINISALDSSIETFVKKGKAENKANTFIIDLKNIKVQKLLGAGKTNKKFEITVKYASQKVKEKIEASGGKLILPKKEE